jgi:hypothetical protein
MNFIEGMAVTYFIYLVASMAWEGLGYFLWAFRGRFQWDRVLMLGLFGCAIWGFATGNLTLADFQHPWYAPHHMEASYGTR